jgi:hypothetical protein
MAFTPIALQDLELPLEGPAVDRGPQRSEVVMVADPAKLHGAAVEPEAVRAVHLDGTDAEPGHRSGRGSSLLP